MSDVIWLTSSYPWSGDTVGGIFFRTQTRALARSGCPVSVVAPVPAVPWPLGHLSAKWRGHAQAPRTEIDGDTEILRPRFPNVPRQPSWALPDRFIADAAWRTRDRWGQPRLIHGHFSIIGLAARRLARRARLPYALTFHGGDLNWWPDLHPERLEDLSATMRDAAAVFTVSAALADRVRSISGVEAQVLPIGVDHRAIAAAASPRDEARRALGLPADRLVVLFVGRLVPLKGVPELVAAVLELDDAFLTVLVGPGPLADHGMDVPQARDRIRYAGSQPHDAVITYMAAADVLVLPSYGEGLPTVLVEAGSIGLPVIASRVGAIPELLAEGRGVLLPEVTADAIRESLAGLHDDLAGMRATGQRLRDHVHEAFDVDRNARRLLDCYREIDATIGSQVAIPPDSEA